MRSAILRLADPNQFDEPIRRRAREGGDWAEVRPAWSWGALRGIGLAEPGHRDKVRSAHRASGEQAFHVLDVLLAIEEAAVAGRTSISRAPAIDRRPFRPTRWGADWILDETVPQDGPMSFV